MLKPDSTPGATPSESLGWSRASVPSGPEGAGRAGTRWAGGWEVEVGPAGDRVSGADVSQMVKR